MSIRYLTVCRAMILAATAFSTAYADQSGNATLAPNTFLNLDSGAVSSSGGDILWNGMSLIPRGGAQLYNLGNYGSRAFKSISARNASRAPYSADPISADSLVAGDVFGIHTNGGNYAKVIVTAARGGSLSLQYTTFMAVRPATLAAGAGGDPPTITMVQNNYSLILPGQPNYGIAPGSIFIIKGTGLGQSQAVLQSSAAPGLQTTLNQISISVTVNGTTTTPALYYTSGAQLAAVLPSTTPVGTGTITVTYNGQTSAPFPIQVVTSAMGLDTLYGTGNGLAVVEDTNFSVLGLTNSATPGQTVIFWGSGVGGDTKNDDRLYPQNQDNLTNIPMQVYVGGISANIVYRGRSQYPGLDMIQAVIPQNVTPGCFVSVVMQSGSIVSNAVTIPVSASGGPCSDPTLGLTGTQLQALANKSNVNALSAIIGQGTNLTGTKTSAFAFAASADSSLFGAGYYYASPGSCTVVQPQAGIEPSGTPLDAGTIQLTTPGGNLNLSLLGGPEYGAQLPTGSLTSSPGTYTFSGSGGKNIGSFRVAVNVQTPLTLTNTSALASITRAQGATVTWSGGFSNGFVLVQGVGPFAGNGSVNFYCVAPASAGQFVIPASTLLALPPGGGNLFVLNTTALQTFSASGLDFGVALAGVSFQAPTTFK